MNGLSKCLVKGGASVSQLVDHVSHEPPCDMVVVEKNALWRLKVSCHSQLLGKRQMEHSVLVFFSLPWAREWLSVPNFLRQLTIKGAHFLGVHP